MRRRLSSIPLPTFLVRPHSCETAVEYVPKTTVEARALVGGRGLHGSVSECYVDNKVTDKGRSSVQVSLPSLVEITACGRRGRITKVKLGGLFDTLILAPALLLCIDLPVYWFSLRGLT